MLFKIVTGRTVSNIKKKNKTTTSTKEGIGFFRTVTFKLRNYVLIAKCYYLISIFIFLISKNKEPDED